MIVVDLWTLAVATIVAPFVGSFLSVLVVRLPKGKDIVFERSHCTNCKTALSVSELVPVFSWLFQKGRCRHCGSDISTLYPLMELAAILVVAWSGFAVSAEVFLPTVILGWALLALAVMDYRAMFLSDYMTLPLIPAGLMMCEWVAPERFWEHAFSTLLAAMLFAGLDWLYYRLRNRQGLGLGDAKLFAAAGAWTGFAGLGTVLIYSIAISLILLLIRKKSLGNVSPTTPIPFGTGLAAGIWLTWLYGPVLVT